MMKRQIIFVITIILSVLFSSCERAAREQSKVVFNLASIKDVGAASSVNKKLVGYFVNVSGSDISPKIVKNDKLSNINDTSGGGLNSTIELIVPSGRARYIQILGIYRIEDGGSLDGTLEAQYGEIPAIDIFGVDPPAIEISLEILGTGGFKAGSVVGRYITKNTLGVDYGPTGFVNIGIIPEKNGKELGVNMDLFRATIVDGWFDFFMSQNFKMTYRMLSGHVIAPLDGKSLDTLTTEIVSSDPTKARVYRPVTYSVSPDGGSTWGPLKTENKDIVYGFFAGGDLTNADLTGKRVCLEEQTSILQNNLSSNPSSQDIYYNYPYSGSPTNIVYGEGGWGMTTHSSITECNISTSINSFSADRINIRKHQFDGYGNDTAKGMRSIFTFRDGGSAYPKKFSSSGNVYTFYVLPGVLRATLSVIDGAKFYHSTKTGINADVVSCTAASLQDNNFNLVTPEAISLSILQDKIDVTLSSVQISALSAANASLLICPTKKNALDIDVVQPEYSFFVGRLL